MADPPPGSAGDPQSELDPDVRFLLANERTLLAWLRTALAFAAGGAGLLQFGRQLALNELLGITLLVLSCVAVPVGLARYRSSEQAIRQHRLPAAGHGPELVAVVLFAIILILAAAATIRSL